MTFMPPSLPPAPMPTPQAQFSGKNKDRIKKVIDYLFGPPLAPKGGVDKSEGKGIGEGGF